MPGNCRNGGHAGTAAVAMNKAGTRDTRVPALYFCPEERSRRLHCCYSRLLQVITNT